MPTEEEKEELRNFGQEFRNVASEIIELKKILGPVDAVRTAFKLNHAADQIEIVLMSSQVPSEVVEKTKEILGEAYTALHTLFPELDN